MPHIGLAMERSLQGGGVVDGLRNLIARSMVAALGTRQSLAGLQNGVSDAKTALSSWDNCMAVTFCKWPVIGIIILGSLILFSILWCCARCLFCGLSCCCECCMCLKCCGQCCGMCDPPGGRKHKYLDEPFIPPHHDQAYRPQAPMDYPPPQPAAAPKREVPQYATFESDKKDADSLPAMPTWNDGSSQKVMVEEEVEMEPLKKPTPSPSVAANATGRTVSPLSAQGHGSPPSVSPYGPPPGRAGANGYMGAAADPYAQQETGYFDGGEYGQQAQPHGMNHSQEYGVDQAYGGGAGAMAMGRQPYQQQGNDMHAYGNQPLRNQPYNQQGMEVDAYGNQVQPQPYGQQGFPQSQTPRPYGDEYGRSMTPGGPARSGTPGSQMRPNGYGLSTPGAYGYDNNPARMNSPGPQGGAGYRASPGPQGGNGYGQQQGMGPSGYGRPPPRRQYTGDSQSQYSAGPMQQQYSGARQQQPYPQAPSQSHDYPTGGAASDYHEFAGSTQQPAELYSPVAIAPPRAAELHSEPASPLHNNAGFDFQSGYARASPAPAAERPAGPAAGYPGQRQYKPQGGY
ncbi:uncharacterized protein B0I36DRAFT_86975 [Microdochium trichocladiopsis]|uniref:Fibroin-3 related protein n=1 Tax=Microdochium trichocladiopsis TaxID=1682393 RepID=A0A9P8YDQ2_9PEZI|nr:uncharacterized protein B0I36DRAFT_86975 [Microdochium trichocladiopsis]KAH7035022.1 hypothetical protein B0I36DRAFT_86975 [Microdochium trichocladiopsis]